MAAPRELDRLIENFDRNIDEYHRGRYNETMLRRDFLDRLIKMLGWDVDNEQGLNELQREVVHEDALKIEGKIKAPDYSIRVNGQRRYFIEAKKPSVNIKDDIAPSFQLRRYAWSAKLPLSLLTDFEEFAVYDTRIRPDRLDRASVARTMYFRYTELSEKWGDFAGIFSKDAVLGGSFDHFAEVTKSKKGTAQVDDEFLVEIDGWREMLAQNLALRNKDLSQRDLNFSVQKIIDRIIFLRISEDRGIEEYGRLRELKEGGDAYKRLLQLFEQADARYNSGLFHFRNEKGQAEGPDRLTPTLSIDDQPLQEICRRLYYPDSPYEFSVLSGMILGQVYEQFLGKVIVLDSRHRASVEVKPEVRKAGGVYYTPEYITRYIIDQTVGELVKNKEPKQVADLRVVDPACGSGSFLLTAFDFLLEWYLQSYTSEAPERLARQKTPPIYSVELEDGARSWRLTTTEKRRILLSHIFGVDLDAQAVEVTKLSLLLKVLENESDQTLGAQLTLLHERVLPDLGNNIKCGNALIGPDFFRNRMFDDEDAERLRLNPFNWRSEFSQVFAEGGFTACVANPPYILLQDQYRDDAVLEHVRAKYESASYKVDTYHLFMEKSLSLLRDGGLMGFITPSNFLTNNYLVGLRRHLLTHAELSRVIAIKGQVFEDATVDTAISILRKDTKPSRGGTLVEWVVKDGTFEERRVTPIDPAELLRTQHVLIKPSSSTGVTSGMDQASVPLKEVATVNFGMQLRNRKLFVDDVIEIKSDADRARLTEKHRPCLTGKDVQRYYTGYSNLYCLEDLIARKGGCWDLAVHHTKNKVLVRQIGEVPICCLDEEGLNCLNTLFMVVPTGDSVSAHALLGLLNSRLMGDYWRERYYDLRETFPKIKGTYLLSLPVPRSLLADDSALASAVRTRIDVQKKHRAAVTADDELRLRRRIEEADGEIEELVRSHFGLVSGGRELGESLQHVGRSRGPS